MIDRITDIINSVQYFFISVGSARFVGGLTWLGGLLVLIFGTLVVVMIIKLRVINKWGETSSDFLLSTAFPKKQLNKSWQKILLRLNKKDEVNLRLALIEVDNLFDDLLKLMRLPGESMADRLKYINSSQVSNIDEIWQAHKLRNQIVHNPECAITRDEIEFGIRAYEKALKELEFIDPVI